MYSREDYLAPEAVERMERDRIAKAPSAGRPSNTKDGQGAFARATGSGDLRDRINDKITELEAEYKRENDEMHRLYSEWPEGSRAAQDRMFTANGKLSLLKELLCPNTRLGHT